MSKILLLSIINIIISITAQGQITPFWQTFPGYDNKATFRTEDGLAVIGMKLNEVYPNIYARNKLHINYFDRSGNHLGEWEWAPDPDTVNFGFDGIYTGKCVIQLNNGQFLVGGHYDKPTTEKTGKIKNEGLYSFNGKYTSHPYQEDKSINSYAVILKMNHKLDSIIEIKTLPDPTPGCWSLIEAIHEKGPDTLLIIRKVGITTHRIMETDSLFNIRWETDFGYYYGYFPRVYGLEITSKNEILVLQEHYHPHYHLKTLPVHIYKFSPEGELLWTKTFSPPERMPAGGGLYPLDQGDTFLLAFCDGAFLQHLTHHWYGDTSINLQVIDKDGNVLENKKMNDFFKYVEFSHLEFYEPGDTVQSDTVPGWHPFPFRQSYIPLHITTGPDNSILITGFHWWVHWRGFMVKLNRELIPQWIRLYEIDKEAFLMSPSYGVNYHQHELTPNAPLWDEQGFIISASFFVYSPQDSVYYDPVSYPYYRSGVLILTDEHGCLEPGCHLADNVPVEEISSGISFFPNPAVTHLNVNISHNELQNKQKLLFISDLSGRHVLHEVFTGNSLQIPVSAIPPGVCIAHVLYNGQVLKAEKIIIGK